MASINENRIICEGKMAEAFSLLGQLDIEFQQDIIKDIKRRIENLEI